MDTLQIVPARGLGDAILWMAAAHKLKEQYKKILFYSDVLCAMQENFPFVKILPYSAFTAEAVVYAADHSLVSRDPSLHSCAKILWEKNIHKEKTMLENILSFTSEGNSSSLSLEKDCGMVISKKPCLPPSNKRIFIHPSSNEEKKNWSLKKFISLARKLEKRNWDIQFIVADYEKEQFKALYDEGFSVPQFPDLSSLLYEISLARCVVGNDSGIGHLASAAGVHVVSLFARASQAKLWRPDFKQGSVLTPLIPLIGAPMKEKYWKNFLTVGQVLRSIKIASNE